VLAAAWLHDVSKAYREERGDGHGRRGAARARAILLRSDFPAGKLDAVSEAIAGHVGLFRDEPPATAEAAVLFDADKLSKLGATSTVHFLCCHPAMARQGGRTADTASAAQETERWLELAPRMVDSLCTAAGREMGRQRLEFLRGFVDQLRLEGTLP
jgi:HD superfamily phosphodiesterase